MPEPSPPNPNQSAWSEETLGRFSAEIDRLLACLPESPLEPHEDVRQRILLWLLDRRVSPPEYTRAFARRLVALFLRHRCGQRDRMAHEQLSENHDVAVEPEPFDLDEWIRSLSRLESGLISTVLDGESWATSCEVSGIPTGSRFKLRKRLQAKLAEHLAGSPVTSTRKRQER